MFTALTSWAKRKEPQRGLKSRRKKEVICLDVSLEKWQLKEDIYKNHRQWEWNCLKESKKITAKMLISIDAAAK